MFCNINHQSRFVHPHAAVTEAQLNMNGTQIEPAYMAGFIIKAGKTSDGDMLFQTDRDLIKNHKNLLEWLIQYDPYPFQCICQPEPVRTTHLTFKRFPLLLHIAVDGNALAGICKVFKNRHVNDSGADKFVGYA